MRIDTAKKEEAPEKTLKQQIDELVVDPGVAEKLEALFTKEKTRIMTVLLKEMPWAVERYKALIKPTGGLLTKSMGVAYAKGMQDALKILGKEKGI